MAQLNLTKDETTMIYDALEREIDSCQRQQNMKGKTIMMKEVYAKHEQTLRALQVKLGMDK